MITGRWPTAGRGQYGEYFRRVLALPEAYWRLAVGSVILIVLGSLAGLLAPWPFRSV